MLLAQAATLVAAGEREAARATIARARVALDRGVFPASAWEREQVEALRPEIEAGSASP